MFTLIDKKIEYFNIIGGQNSIIYDPNFLVFGNDDLIMNIKTNKCSSSFAKGRSITYNTEPSGNRLEINGNQNLEKYRMLISDNKETEC